MPEAVIVDAIRTPIGRAGKGSLNSIRPDDLTVQMVRAALAKVPQPPQNLCVFIACVCQWENGMVIRLCQGISHPIARPMFMFSRNNFLVN